MIHEEKKQGLSFCFPFCFRYMIIWLGIVGCDLKIKMKTYFQGIGLFMRLSCGKYHL